MTILDEVAAPEVEVKAEALPDADADKKFCMGCDKMVLRTLFYKHSSAKDGLQSRCRGCDKKRATTPKVVESKEPLDRGPPYEGVTGGPLIYGYVR